MFQRIKASALGAVLVFINGCDGIQFSKTELPSKTIRVVALQNPLSKNRSGYGWEYDLLTEFSKRNHAKLTWKTVQTTDEWLHELQNGFADIGAGRINHNWSDQLNVLRGPAYDETELVVICPKKTKLATQLTVNEMYADAAYEILDNVVAEKKSSKHILTKISKSESTCTLLEEREAQFLIRFYPSLKIVQKVQETQSIGFVTPHDQHEMQFQLLSWFQTYSRTDLLMRLRTHYTHHLQKLTVQDQKKFFKTAQSKMNGLKPLFQKAAKEFSLPWQLVAAVAFQESHWNNDAKSFTGVKGIMMLTEITALHLGVEDRTDLEQSIWGGAKYLKYLIDQVPPSVNNRDRLCLALAAYNVGPAHLFDVQFMVASQGDSSYSWPHVRQQMLWLAKNPDRVSLEHGKARWREPVHFVERVLNYYDLLNSH